MKYKILPAFLLMAFYLLFSVGSAANYKYSVSINQQMQNGELQISFFIKSLQKTDKALGSTDFIIKLDKENLKLDQAYIIDSTRGAFDASKNSDAYHSMQLGTRNNLINLAVLRKINGSDIEGTILKTTKMRVAKISVPVKNYCGSSNVTWAPELSAYQDFQGNNIKSEINFNAPDTALSLATSPQKLSLKKPSDTVSCENAPIKLKTNAGANYQWYLDSNFVKETIKPEMEADSTGLYQVRAVRCKKYSSLSNVISLRFKPLPEKPAIKENSGSLITNASGNIQWYLDDKKIKGATGKKLFPDKSGYYKVAKTNNCGTVFSEEKQISIMDNAYAERQFDLDIKPNPFSEKCKIRFNLPSSRHVFISLWDINGKKVAEFADQKMESGVHKLNIEDGDYNLSDGKYLLKIVFRDKKIIRSLVKTK